jgi:hypothetical protein
MTILERNRGIERRMVDLRPIQPKVEATLKAGKREQLMQGVDARGVPYTPLLASTLRGKRVSPRPLVGLKGEASPLITGYAVETTVKRGSLEVSAGWPGQDYVRYLRTGTGRMVARDPGGFRPKDLEECRKLLRLHVLGGGAS